MNAVIDLTNTASTEPENLAIELRDKYHAEKNKNNVIHQLLNFANVQLAAENKKFFGPLEDIVVQISSYYILNNTPEKAIKWLIQLISIQNYHYGFKHAALIKTHSSLGAAYAALNDFTSAISHLRIAQCMADSLGVDELTKAIILGDIANAYESVNIKIQYAILMDALAMKTVYFSLNSRTVQDKLMYHREIGIGEAQLGKAALSLNLFAEAITYLSRAVANLEVGYGSDHRLVSLAQYLLGRAYTKKSAIVNSNWDNEKWYFGDHSWQPNELKEPKWAVVPTERASSSSDSPRSLL